MGVKSGMKLTTHLHLVLRSRMRGAMPPLLPRHSWLGALLKQRDSSTLPYITIVITVCVLSAIFPRNPNFFLLLLLILVHEVRGERGKQQHFLDIS
jgi:hypothetical protein